MIESATLANGEAAKVYPKAATRKMKRCKVCKTPFIPRTPFVVWCSIDCAIKIAAQRVAKARDKNLKAQRQELRERKEKLKTRSDYIKQAQEAFNAYIRERDKDKPCICCGEPLTAGDVGGRFDCGHYRSVGSAYHLRFNENNAHGQRKQCNRWGAGRAVDYRIGLVARIGLEAVEALECDNTSPKWTIEELKAIRTEYKQKTKRLKEASE